MPHSLMAFDVALISPLFTEGLVGWFSNLGAVGGGQKKKALPVSVWLRIFERNIPSNLVS